MAAFQQKRHQLQRTALATRRLLILLPPGISFIHRSGWISKPTVQLFVLRPAMRLWTSFTVVEASFEFLNPLGKRCSKTLSQNMTLEQSSVFL
jgi:hypothetical protein